MPLGLSYDSSASEVSSPASPRKSPTSIREQSSNDNQNGTNSLPIESNEEREEGALSPDEPSSRILINIKGTSRPIQNGNKLDGFKVKGSAAFEPERDEVFEQLVNSSRKASSSKADRSPEDRPTGGLVMTPVVVKLSSPSEAGALEATPRQNKFPSGRKASPSPQLGRGKPLAENEDLVPKNDRRRSRERESRSPQQERRVISGNLAERESLSRYRSESESDDQSHRRAGLQYRRRSPRRETVKRDDRSSRYDEEPAFKNGIKPLNGSPEQSEQRTSRRLTEDPRNRDYHRSSRTSRRPDDGLDYEAFDYEEARRHDGRSRHAGSSQSYHDVYRSSGRDRYDDYRDDRRDRYRDDRDSYRRGPHDDSYRGYGRDREDRRIDPSRERLGYPLPSRPSRPERYEERDRDVARGHRGDRSNEDDRPSRSPSHRGNNLSQLPMRADSLRREKGDGVRSPSLSTAPEFPAPPPSLPDIPPPPPSPGLKRKSPPLEGDAEGVDRAHKRPKLVRQEASSSHPAEQPSLPAKPLPPIPLPASGARTPNPQLRVVKEEVRVSTPTSLTESQASRNLKEEEARQDRARKRDLFPDRSRIGLGQGRRLDIAREAKIYGKKFTGLGRLEGYKMVKSGDGNLGRGTFGTVTKATRISDGMLVALKMLQNPQQAQSKPGSPRKDGMLTTTTREIKNLKLLDHENIVPLLEMVVQRKSGDTEADIFLVFPYMEHDLCGYIHSTESTLTVDTLRIFAAQLLDGLKEMHRNKIVHRDLKSANILINNKGLLQIADFGLSRALGSNHHASDEDDAHYTNMVVTRWYRAPELLMGETMYGPEVDMWSIGCILAEMFTKKVFIMGKSNSHQLMRIFLLVGPPRPGTWPRFDQFLQYNDVQEDDPSFAKKSVPVQEIVSSATNVYSTYHNTDLKVWSIFETQKQLEALIKLLLDLDPAKRPTAQDARAHPFFTSVPGASRNSIAPLRNDSRESGSMARNAMSQQMRDDLSIDPFHLKPGMAPPVYPVPAPGYGYPPMSNNVQLMPAGAGAGMMYGSNQASTAMQAGLNQGPRSAQQNFVNTNGMTSAPISHMPGTHRFNNNSNRSTPNHIAQTSFNPSRGPMQPGLNTGLPYGNTGPPPQNYGGLPRNGAAPGFSGQGPSQLLPVPSYAAPVRPMPGGTFLPTRPTMTNGANGMYTAPNAPMPGQRR